MRNIKLICLINIILSIIAMLFHEAYVVFYCATIFALIFYKDNYSSDKLRVNSLLYCIPVLVGFVIITSLGKPSIPHEVLVEMIKSNLDQTIRYESINLTAIQYSSVSEKIAIVTKFLKETPKNIISSILTILYLAPLSVVFITILIKKARKDKKTHIIFSLLLLGVSCLIPLVSALFGYDFFRWLGISVICVSSVLIATVYIDGDMNAIINKLFAKRWKIILPISLVYLFGGNLGALISTPLIERVSYVILHYIS
ncbi:MAG: hypothetical protein KAQ68_05050 [Clostridiales bacterium]|nr:hypothetical protein [Clostridiales bacterium]